MINIGSKREMPLHIMLLPGVILVLVFSYIPMAGLVMAFQKFVPTKGIFHSKWIGLQNFKYLLDMPDTYQVLWNTIFIALMKIAFGLIVPILFALLLNEIAQKNFKKVVQTLIYMPYFLSWIILSGILIDILSPSSGIVNMFIKFIGIEPVFFLGDVKLFPFVLVISNVWKEAGFGTVIYLAALTNIDPTLYEASTIDGAGRWKQTLNVTLPGILPIIVLMGTLSMGNVLNAGFDQVFNLYNPIVYKSGDIIDTFIYRLGMVDVQYSVATAVGFFKSIVSFIMISVSYGLAYKYADYRIF